MHQDFDSDLNAMWQAAWPVAQKKWSRLTEADLLLIDGDAETLGDCLRQRYGFSTERALQEAFAFCHEASPASRAIPV